MKILFVIIISAIVLMGCGGKDNSDAWGSFEADEIIISARIPGNIAKLYAREGSLVQAGELIAVIDTTDLALNKDELQSSVRLLDLKIKAAEEKHRIGKTEKANLVIEQQRFLRLISQNAASQKQLDDIEGNLRVLEQKLELNAIETQMARAEKSVALNKLDAVNGNIQKCYLRAPLKSTILSTYAGENEFVATGKPIVKLADISHLKAVFYITGTQLTTLKTGQQIQVRIDGTNRLQTYPAQVTYISGKAEFTPKVIQTREERVKLVYRVEALCANDGSLKPGMPVEIIF